MYYILKTHNKIKCLKKKKKKEGGEGGEEYQEKAERDRVRIGRVW